MRFALFILTFSAIGCGDNSNINPEPPDMRVPVKLRVSELPPVPPVPSSVAGDALTEDRIALGTLMFFDTRLSGSRHTNCNACHPYNTSFQDNLITAIPDRSYPSDRPALTRNTPSFDNILYAPVFRWDGSHTDLTAVMAFPFSEPNMNLGGDVPSAQIGLKQRLTVDVPGYLPLFQKAYGQDLRALSPSEVWALAGRALAAFVTKAVSRDSAFDRWNAGDDKAMPADAVKGLEVFRGKGRCIACHVGPFFTDFSFHNLSTSPPDQSGRRADEGRFLITGKPADRGAFLTPTLRGTYDTAPYFHDGMVFSLRTVIGHLSSAAVLADPNHDPIFNQPLSLSDDEVDSLVAFLKALRGAPIGDTIIPPPPNTP